MTKVKETVTATSKYNFSTKVDVIISKIRGKSYKEALQILKYLPQKSELYGKLYIPLYQMQQIILI